MCIPKTPHLNWSQYARKYQQWERVAFLPGIKTETLLTHAMQTNKQKRSVVFPLNSTANAPKNLLQQINNVKYDIRQQSSLNLNS